MRVGGTQETFIGTICVICWMKECACQQEGGREVLVWITGYCQKFRSRRKESYRVQFQNQNSFSRIWNSRVCSLFVRSEERKGRSTKVRRGKWRHQFPYGNRKVDVEKMWRKEQKARGGNGFLWYRRRLSEEECTFKLVVSLQGQRENGGEFTSERLIFLPINLTNTCWSCGRDGERMREV